MINFTLHPFPADRLLPAIEIDGKIDRSGGNLSIEYQLSGDLTQVEIAPPAPPARKFELWEATCFEFFLGVPSDRDYWEFNLAPAGDWNIFHLDDYRQGLRDELAFTSLPFKVEQQPNSLLLSLEFDLSKIVSVDQSIEVSVTTVIKSADGEISYWAVTHCGSEADFHRRDSFTINLYTINKK
jgi:hypothetical protein